MEHKPYKQESDPEYIAENIRGGRKVRQQQNLLELKRMQAEEEEKLCYRHALRCNTVLTNESFKGFSIK